MGAHIAVKTYDPTQLQKDVRQAFAADCEQARFVDGEGRYNGSIAQFHSCSFRRTDCPFDDCDAAEEWIGDHHKKWDTTALAVTFKVPSKASSTAETKAVKAINLADNAFRTTVSAIFVEIKGHKSKLVTCKHCGSKIARRCLQKDYQMAAICPVCLKTLLLISQEKKIQRAKDKLKKANEKLSDATKKKKATIWYMVGGLVSS